MEKYEYDGVLCEVIGEHKGALELRVLKKMPWPNSPDVGGEFFVDKNNEMLIKVD